MAWTVLYSWSHHIVVTSKGGMDSALILAPHSVATSKGGMESVGLVLVFIFQTICGMKSVLVLPYFSLLVIWTVFTISPGLYILHVYCNIYFFIIINVLTPLLADY